MFIPITSELYIKPIITIRVSSLAVVETYFFGSTLTSDGSLGVTIHLHLQKISLVYGMLEKWIWTFSHITHKTKMNVYRSCVLCSYVLSQTQTLLCRHLKILEHFHQKFLRHILKEQEEYQNTWHKFLWGQEGQTLSFSS